MSRPQISFQFVVVDGGSQRLLGLNPATVMVVLLLGLWLLLGCDNMLIVDKSFNHLLTNVK